MGIMPDTSPFGGQTVTGPGWPNVDEDVLAAAAASYEALAARLAGGVVPAQQGQLMLLSDTWEGAGATAAVGEAGTIVGGHEANAARATAIAAALRRMEAAVVRAKTAANAVAVETQRECEALAAVPLPNVAELVQSRIALGLSQNTAQVTAAAGEIAAALGTAPTIPSAATAPPDPAQTAQAAAMAAQLAGQLGGLAAQLPQQFGQVVGQLPQQLSQPVQQLTSLLGGLGRSGGTAAPAPFSAFSKHPLAGGSGAGAGAGMVRAASVPGAGGSAPQSPLLANLLGGQPAAAAVAPGAGPGGAVAGPAPVPVGAGMGAMGPLGMMGGPPAGAGTRPGLPVPELLEHDLGEDADDDW